MDMPKPGDAHRRLQALVGEWTGSETMHPAPWDPVGGPATARIVNTSILNGFAVVQQYQQLRGGASTFSGHGVFWFDEAAGEYVMTWWDSMGGPGSNFRGQFDGDRLVLVAPMPQGGRSRATFAIGLPGHYRFIMEISPDGEQWLPAMEGAYGRMKPTRATKPSTPAAPRPRKAAKASPSRKAAGRKRPTKKRAAKKTTARKVVRRTTATKKQKR